MNNIDFSTDNIFYDVVLSSNKNNSSSNVLVAPIINPLADQFKGKLCYISVINAYVNIDTNNLDTNELIDIRLNTSLPYSQDCGNMNNPSQSLVFLDTATHICHFLNSDYEGNVSLGYFPTSQIQISLYDSTNSLAQHIDYARVVVRFYLK